MRHMRRSVSWGVFGLGALLLAGNVRAAILDDILGVATTARDRATQARDRATEARNRATLAFDRAAEARDNTQELVDNARMGLAALNDQVRDMITHAIEDMQQLVERELEGLSEFTADGGCSAAVCEPFRQDLIEWLQHTQAIVNSLFSIFHADELHLNFDREIAILNVIPGRLLFPLYRVLSADNSLVGTALLDRLSETESNLALIKDALAGSAPSAANRQGQTPLESEVASCAFLMDHYDAVGEAKMEVSDLATILKLSAKWLKSKGETTAEGANPGIHGYINVTIKDNALKEFGEKIEGVSEGLAKAAEKIDDKARDCVLFTAHLDTLKNQQDILNAIDGIKCPAVARTADLDRDGDTDLADYSLFQGAFDEVTGPALARLNQGANH